jgi:hypothetical protein
MEITPELDRIISAVAEAKMHFLIVATMKAGPERAEEIKLIARSTAAARELLPLIGGFERLPRNIAIELRTCELAVEKLSGT